MLARIMAGPVSAVARIPIHVLIVVLAVGGRYASAADDPWAAGTDLPEWREITRIQQLDPDPPLDWPRL